MSLEYSKSWLNEEDFPLLGFTRNWESSADFPTYEPDELQVRKDMQCLHDETKNYINDELIPKILAADATEAYRSAAEEARTEGEVTRVSNEELRVSNEGARETAETTRMLNEDARLQQETLRENNEQSRVAVEEIRVSNESARVLNEEQRLVNEAAREALETGYVAQAEAAALRAEEAAAEAEKIVGGDFYTTDETLDDATKTLFNLTHDSVPAEVFAKIGVGGMNYIPTTVPDGIIFDEWKEYSNFPVDTASYNICDVQYIDGAYYLLVQRSTTYPYAIKLYKSEDMGKTWSDGKTLWEPEYADIKADRIFGVRGKICVTTCGASGSGKNYSRVYTMNSFEDEAVCQQIQDYANSVNRYYGYWKMANGYLFLISNTTTTPKMYAYNPETNTVLQSGGFNGPSTAYMYDVCHYEGNIYLLSVKGSQGAPSVYRMTLDFAADTFSFTPYSYIKSGGGWFIPVGDDILEVEWNSSSGFNGLYKITSVTESGYDEERLITYNQIGNILYAVKYRGKTLLFAEAVKVNDDKTAAYAFVELSDDLKSFTVIKEYPNGMYSYFGRGTQVNYWPSFEPESVLTYSFWNYVDSSKVNGLAYTANTYKVIPKIVDYHGADVVLPSAQLDFGTRVAAGSYQGTGTYGQSNPTKLEFDFTPKIVFLMRANPGGTYVGSWYYSSMLIMTPYVAITENDIRILSYGETISWYAHNNSSAVNQWNDVNSTYYYVAIG